MKNYKQYFNTEWIKEHWWLVTASSTICIYTIAFIKTIVFFDEFHIPIFSFFDLSDYIRIMFMDISLFMFSSMMVIAALALSLVRNAIKEFTEHKGKEYVGSLFVKFFAILLLFISLATPVSLSINDAKMIKSGAYKEVSIKLKEKDLSKATILGGTNNYIFIYDLLSHRAHAINVSEIIKISFNGPNKALKHFYEKREQNHRESRH